LLARAGIERDHTSAEGTARIGQILSESFLKGRYRNI
jgi:hypothetical protein